MQCLIKYTLVYILISSILPTQVNHVGMTVAGEADRPSCCFVHVSYILFIFHLVEKVT